MLKRPTLNQLTTVSILANLLLCSVKFAVGFFAASASMLADALHSLSDMITDGIAWAGMKISRQPADEDHPYGHGRFETLATLMIAAILLYVAWGIFFRAVQSLYHQEVRPIGWSVLIAAAASILIKEWLFHWTRDFARRERSPAVLANAWHHRSDALSSLAVFFGALASLAGYRQGDQVAALVVGVMIAHLCLGLLKGVLQELLEKQADSEVNDRLREILQAVPQVESFHKLRSRRVGGEVFIDVHIQVDGGMSVRDSHDLTGQIKRQLLGLVEHPVNLLIHVEPPETDSNQSLPTVDSPSGA